MGFLFVSFVGFRVSGAAGSFSEQVPQHQPHGSQRPCTWQRALQPLSVSSSLQSTFEASSLASEFSPLCGVVHSPCHRVGLTQHVWNTFTSGTPFEQLAVHICPQTCPSHPPSSGVLHSLRLKDVVLTFVFSSFFQLQVVVQIVGIPKPQIIEESVQVQTKSVKQGVDTPVSQVQKSLSECSSAFLRRKFSSGGNSRSDPAVSARARFRAH